MPVIVRYKGYRFFFYSNEGNPPEPLHVHVRQGGSLAKFWMESEITVAENYGMNSAELRELLRVAELNRGIIERKWNEYFGS